MKRALFNFERTSLNTQRAYTDWLRRYGLSVHKPVVVDPSKDKDGVTFSILGPTGGELPSCFRWYNFDVVKAGEDIKEEDYL